MENYDKPAFPINEICYHEGMDYRDWLVGQIASGVAANSEFKIHFLRKTELASYVVDFADAIIKELEERNVQ